jgi:recombination DNA repair RAD52 pathway protein
MANTPGARLILPGEDPIVTPFLHGAMCLTQQQRQVLSMKLNPDRVATRTGDRKTLSYLEAWDVKAHLTRVFGFGGWDSELVEYRGAFERTYMRADFKGQGDQREKVGETEMVEICYTARVALTVKCEHGVPIAYYVEAAAGQANVRADNASRGDAHDNALKQAESDALKRAAISLGTQFGLSLYNNGSTDDVVKAVLVNGYEPEETPEQQQALENGLGVKVEGGETTDAHAQADEQ